MFSMLGLGLIRLIIIYNFWGGLHAILFNDMPPRGVIHAGIGALWVNSVSLTKDDFLFTTVFSIVVSSPHSGDIHCLMQRRGVQWIMAFTPQAYFLCLSL